LAEQEGSVEGDIEMFDDQLEVCVVLIS
jgi:hypothetical protein